MQKTYNKTEILANGHSSESAQRELSNRYQHDRVKMVIKTLCVLVLSTKVTLALEGLMHVPGTPIDFLSSYKAAHDQNSDISRQGGGEGGIYSI